MRVAITFRYQAEHERCDDEYGYSFFGGSEAESLPHFIEFETPALFKHEYFCGVFFVYSCAAAPLPRGCGTEAGDFRGGSCFCRGRTKTER
jgi:hypothetical protein